MHGQTEFQIGSTHKGGKSDLVLSDLRLQVLLRKGTRHLRSKEKEKYSPHPQSHGFLFYDFGNGIPKLDY
jgi:hypothetical protein